MLVSTAYADPRYAITMNDGSVEIMQLMQGTPEEAVAKWSPEHKSRVVSITPIDSADLPQDRSFRNAWKFDRAAKKFDVDMPKARDLWKEKLLRDRQEAVQAWSKLATFLRAMSLRNADDKRLEKIASLFVQANPGKLPGAKLATPFVGHWSHYVKPEQMTEWFAPFFADSTKN